MTFSDEEEQGLVQRPPAILGLKFRDEEDRELVRKVTIASAGLVVLSVILSVMHVHHVGQIWQAIAHTAFALILPGLGYLGVRKESPRLIWVFHIGNVQYAVFHGVVALLLFQALLVVEEHTSAEECKGEISQPLIYDMCIKKVDKLKDQIPAKLLWWAIMTFPLWACMIYAAYQAHEYYFRLRIRGLIARTGEGGQATITSAEDETSNAVE